jgi:hypothetical protein
MKDSNVTYTRARSTMWIPTSNVTTFAHITRESMFKCKINQGGKIYGPASMTEIKIIDDMWYQYRYWPSRRIHAVHELLWRNGTNICGYIVSVNNCALISALFYTASIQL